MLFHLCRELALEFNDCLLPEEGGVHGDNDAEYTSTEDLEEPQDVSGAEQVSNEAEVDDDDVINEDDLIETKSIIVKADGAGSLTSIQDTVDEMSGISVRHPILQRVIAASTNVYTCALRNADRAAGYRQHLDEGHRRGH
jgi:hypothetical protein